MKNLKNFFCPRILRPSNSRALPGYGKIGTEVYAYRLCTSVICACARVRFSIFRSPECVDIFE